MNTGTFLNELQGALLISVVAISALVLAELLSRITALPAELTRKFAHIGSGFAVLLIPVFIENSFTVLALALSFCGLMLGTHATGMLGGVHGVERGLGGVLWYPVTGWVTFFVVFDLREGTYLEYAIPILVLACADAMGAVVGKRWGKHKYEVIPGHFRSLEGSFTFFIVALLCIAPPLAFGQMTSPWKALAVGLLVSALATMYEAVSVHGIDNLLVPFGTLMFLDYLIPLTGSQLALQAFVIISICVTGLILRWHRPVTGGSGAAYVLSVYTILVFGGLSWLPALAALIAVFMVYERLTPVPAPYAKARYELATTVIGLTAPVIFAFLFYATNDPVIRHAIYVGYVASIVCQAAVLAFIVPQHRTFRLSRLRRVICNRDPWQHGPTTGKLLLASCSGGLMIFVSLGALYGDGMFTMKTSDIAVLVFACFIGVTSFITLAATRCARRSCSACGNITLHGMGCCHTLELGVGDTVSASTLTFRKTYLLANLLAATCAALVVIAWSL